MINYTGQFLQSTPALDGTDFEKAILFIAEDNEKGSTGFIINKPFPRKLNELLEFKEAVPFPLYTGGPVVTDGIFMLHRRPDIIEDCQKIAAGIFLGGNMQQTVAAINEQSITETDIKLFIGYCGWDAAQLQDEVEEGSWQPFTAEGSFSPFT